MTYIPSDMYSKTLKNIRATLAGLGSDPDRSRATVVIVDACLARGLNTKDYICKIAIGAEMNNRQVAKIIDLMTGDDPDLYPWYVDSEGHYWKHPT